MIIYRGGVHWEDVLVGYLAEEGKKLDEYPVWPKDQIDYKRFKTTGKAGEGSLKGRARGSLWL
jgi:hypothetical protein